jgi:hypothetical protein
MFAVQKKSPANESENTIGNDEKGIDIFTSENMKHVQNILNC